MDWHARAPRGRTESSLRRSVRSLVSKVQRYCLDPDSSRSGYSERERHEVLSGPLFLTRGARPCVQVSHIRVVNPSRGCVHRSAPYRYAIEELRIRRRTGFPIASRSVIRTDGDPRKTVTMIGCRDFGQGS